jgi:hypothetical protein
VLTGRHRAGRSLPGGESVSRKWDLPLANEPSDVIAQPETIKARMYPDLSRLGLLVLLLRRRLVQSALGAPRRVMVRHQFADERDQFLGYKTKTGG